jgi:uncharacterized membrane protein
MSTILQSIKRYFLTGLLVLVPAWGTFLILQTLFNTIDKLLFHLLGQAGEPAVPGLGIVAVVALILLAGIIARQLIGQRLLQRIDEWLQRLPVVRLIYQTLKSMADLFNFRARFGRSTVVVFPFPREGLWAIGFIMGRAPEALQVNPRVTLVMIFVPTAIHPFTGYLAFVPQDKVVLVNLLPEDAMKMEFSAGLYRPRQNWLTGRPPAGHRESFPS